MGNRYWFRQKPHGYGAVPSTWEGRLVTYSYSALLLFLLWGLPWLVPVGGTHWHTAILFMVAIPATALLLWIIYRRTEGEWRWRPRG